MARTELEYDDFVANSELADPAGSAINDGAGEGHFIEAAEPEKTLLRVVTAAGGGGDITVVAGDYPPALASGQGDLVVTLGAEETNWLGPFESGRFMRGDGRLHIDFESGADGTITAFRVPRNT